MAHTSRDTVYATNRDGPRRYRFDGRFPKTVTVDTCKTYAIVRSTDKTRRPSVRTSVILSRTSEIRPKTYIDEKKSLFETITDGSRRDRVGENASGRVIITHVTGAGPTCEIAYFLATRTVFRFPLFSPPSGLRRFRPTLPPARRPAALRRSRHDRSLGLVAPSPRLYSFGVRDHNRHPLHSV